MGAGRMGASSGAVAATLACLAAGLLLGIAGVEAARRGKAAEGDGKLVFYLFTEQCFDTLLVRWDLLDVPCLKQVVSRGLSYGIILGAGALKLPQIVTFLRTMSVEGVSPTMLYLDVCAFLPGPIYNILHGYPFFTYGEQVIILIQNVVLVLIMWSISKDRPSLLFMSALTAAGCGIAFVLYTCPREWWPLMPLFSATFTVAGRIPQAVANFRQKHTGTLSAITWFFQFAGAAARIFTTLQETQDTYTVVSLCFGSVLSGIVLLQIFCYWGNTKAALAREKAKIE